MKETKKLIRQDIEEALNNAILKFDSTSTSKKTKKLIKEASKNISAQLKDDLKKKSKAERKLSDAKKKIVRKSA